MVLRLRLQRFGRRDRAFYRMVLAHARAPRDGKFIELVGTYNPFANKAGIKEVSLKVERIRYWIGVGAKPSSRVEWLLGQFGILPPKVVPVATTKAHLRKRPEKKTKKELREEQEAAERAEAIALAAAAEADVGAAAEAAAPAAPSTPLSTSASAFHTTAFASSRGGAGPTFSISEKDSQLNLEAGGLFDVPVAWGTGGLKASSRADDLWETLLGQALEHDNGVIRAKGIGLGVPRVRSDGVSKAAAAIAVTTGPFFPIHRNGCIRSLEQQLGATRLSD